MSEANNELPTIPEEHTPQTVPNAVEAQATGLQSESQYSWIKLLVQPLLLLGAGAILIIGLGVAQKLGWVSSGGGGATHVAATEASNTRYICPMMCTPPQAEPGRCPVCAMELVPAASGNGPSDSRSVQLDPVARRIANIRTAATKRMSLERTIRAIGELSYDEGSLKTLSAYVDGRLEKLYADYTGVVVEKGDHLALVYSPKLFSAQVEYLLSKKAHGNSQSSSLQRVVESSSNLYKSAKQRLIELGMTEPQIAQLEEQGEANSRMHLCAPISGTVIEKLAVEGQYVKEGQVIYQLADLSTVWLMLELFPEDAATIHYGQKVEAEVQSLPGKTISGRVAFIDPTVDPMKRTVGVRVAVPNPNGLLRVGDYAKATIRAPLAVAERDSWQIYDPELAGQWISPRHPQIVRSSPGQCPVCGIDLVPAADFGFTDKPVAMDQCLVIPRSAVLMNGGHSVVYVETEPGRFEIRHVTVGMVNADQVGVLDGLEEGDLVATSGNFLIDSQMQLAGNPSLIDPTKGMHGVVDTESAEIESALAMLSAADRKLAEEQSVCPVTMYPLGSMGVPPKVEVEGRTVFLCCEGCREVLMEESTKYLAMLSKGVVSNSSGEGESDLPEIGAMEIIISEPSSESSVEKTELEVVR
ncbi:efflux RND transporter periplasmic adaptor subunit [Bythopirellula goksoeyrii]|uniref:Cation efflux system protein CusB n=1 Tax=Bythopirellula goksoeyrii TaxID=1400387 RepID=A0A5B9QNX0_9BACT|nr:efflux RND transporter periplasmic adaptor subunit [Bythopirellula goksoeyrii]QEG35811.1 Cation efflux system protein CusB precursor [Bythopirellula goksoeyrii]